MAYLSTSNPNLWPPSSSGGTPGLVTVSYEVLASAGQFAAASISAQQYRWLEILVYGWVSSTSANVILEVNGTITGYLQQIRGYASSTLSAAAYSVQSTCGALSGIASSPSNPGVCRVLMPLVPSGPHPYEASGGYANGVATQSGTWGNLITGQNTDTNPATSVRVIAQSTTFASGSSLTIFGMGVS